MEEVKFIVRVSCITYNHAPFIIDTLNGFTMQQTNFPFVCTIIDDASTDGEQEVINNYLEDNFDLGNKDLFRKEETDDYCLIFARHKTNLNCYFAVFYLKYNHYSIQKAKRPYIVEWVNAKYTAICEGDDYWIHPRKLQIQVDYLNSHNSFSMCWHDAKILDMKSCKISGNHRRYRKDTTCPTEDIIIQGGGGCPTASIMYRSELRSNAPDSLFKHHIGDYPLQLYMSFNGKVRYIDSPMSIYRINVPGSWTTSVAGNTNVDERKKIWSLTMKLFDDFNEYSCHRYDSIFNQRKYIYLFYEHFAIGDYSTARKYWYKCSLSTRPWSIGIVLYSHGFGFLLKSLKNFYKYLFH